MRALWLVVLLVGCTPAPVVATNEADAVIAAPDPPDASVGVTRPLVDDAVDAGPKLCGCGLCEPLSSGDACKTDADCAGDQPCHAMACVAKAKSTPRTKDTVCTQEVRCASIDANACGCVAGMCALHKTKP
jgi:hypothetical protein